MNGIEVLIDKYNVPVPRYTSYPTVPFWKDYVELKPVADLLKTTLLEDGISVYIHLPFCESLCTYCGCNKRITKNHSVEEKYIQYLLKEWDIYRSYIDGDIILKELHLGGGTPTFFSSENLKFLINELTKDVIIHPEFEGSFEGHPNNTTDEHLVALYEVGFRRVSFGVQDLDEKVQHAIHRIQPHEHVLRVTEAARSIGYTSVNFDLIYGLPFQTLDSIERTFQSVIELQPDRIAFYSYAHVPWVSKSQRAYDENDLPSGLEKRKLYERGREILLQAGYQDIGMDHFSLSNESLYIAQQNKKLHRNFMGYTTSNAKISIGLGVSAISDFFWGYRQNEKVIEDYYLRLDKMELPLIKGVDLQERDAIQRQHILNITCNFETQILSSDLEIINQEYANMLIQDGLLEINQKDYIVTEMGKSFLRNIAALFDTSYTFQQDSAQRQFSYSV